MGTLGLVKDTIFGLCKLPFGRELTGPQRNLVTLIGKIPDRVPINCAVTNINPSWVGNDKYDYNSLTHSPKLSIEYIKGVMELLPDVDWWAEPWIGGLLLSEGAAECGTTFEFPKETFPYPIRYPLNSAQDLEHLVLKEGGYLEKYIDTLVLIQDEIPGLYMPPVIPAPWTLGTFIRGADRLIQDFLIYKQHITTKSAASRRKLERRASARAIDPLFWEREMEVFVRLCEEVLERHKEAGTLKSFGNIIYDLYASPPNLDVESYSHYVLPYAKQLTSHLRFSLLTWQPTRPEEITVIKKKYPNLLIGNLGYEIDEKGHFSKEYDADTIDIANEFKTFTILFLAPDFLRDASETSVREYTSHLCSLVKQKNCPAIFSLVGIPAYTPHENVQAVIDVIQREGWY